MPEWLDSLRAKAKAQSDRPVAHDDATALSNVTTWAAYMDAANPAAVLWLLDLLEDAVADAGHGETRAMFEAGPGDG